MFVVHCDECEARTLIFPEQVEGMADDGAGRIVVAYHCSRGHHGLLVTGRGAATAAHEEAREPATVGC